MTGMNGSLAGVPALTRRATVDPKENVARRVSGGSLELLDRNPTVNVLESEYRRLLGYPGNHAPTERALELATWARHWYAENGRPWVYLRETEIEVANDTLRIDGTEFRSKQLHDHLRATKAERAMLVVASAGAEGENHARKLWEEAKPDEYFFLEIFGSAVVEHLVATMSGRICDVAERDGLMAVPHYSPGYAGWDVADQNKLFELIVRGKSEPEPFPQPLEALSSGMLRPKKSLLGVFGLTRRTAEVLASPALAPCERCSFSPCQYRRQPYRFAATNDVGFRTLPSRASIMASGSPLDRDLRYTTNTRALKKWAQERVQLSPRSDGTIDAVFHFDGTTCSNMGEPLAFDYVVKLGSAETGYSILETDCVPAADDLGYTKMCSYLSDADGLMRAIASEKPLLGRPLNDIGSWTRAAAPSGCHCSSESRLHKWGLALEAIHYALAHAAELSPQLAPPPNF
jgi:hypothetical protein